MEKFLHGLIGLLMRKIVKNGSYLKTWKVLELLVMEPLMAMGKIGGNILAKLTKTL